MLVRVVLLLAFAIALFASRAPGVVVDDFGDDIAAIVAVVTPVTTEAPPPAVRADVNTVFSTDARMPPSAERSGIFHPPRASGLGRHLA